MKKNMGSVDTSLRIIPTVTLGILMLTGVISFCPLYTIFKISTRRQEAAKYTEAVLT